MKIKEFFENTIDTIKDKRFSWRFKICNIITNDWLRLQLASVAHQVNETLYTIKIHTEMVEPSPRSYEYCVYYTKKRMTRAQEDIKEIWHI